MKSDLIYYLMGTIVKDPNISYVVEVFDADIKPREVAIGDYKYKQGGYPRYKGVKDIINDRSIYSDKLDFYDEIIENFSENKFSISEEECGRKHILRNLKRKLRLFKDCDNIVVKVHTLKFGNKRTGTLTYNVKSIDPELIKLEDDFGDIECIEK